jgi:DNA replication and repair protein RecF
VRDLREPVAEAYCALAPEGGDATLDYKASWCISASPVELVSRDDIAAELTGALERAEREEVQRGVTVVGPHRDDLLLNLGSHPAKGYASHGESWSIVLALRLAAFTLLRSDGDDPVLILDDVFAELDAGRRDRLADMVCDAEQVLVTAAVVEDIPRTLTGARFAVDAGQVRRD